MFLFLESMKYIDYKIPQFAGRLIKASTSESLSDCLQHKFRTAEMPKIRHEDMISDISAVYQVEQKIMMTSR